MGCLGSNLDARQRLLAIIRWINRTIVLLAALGGLAPVGDRKIMKSGEVRYDRDNKEVQLIRAFVSEKPEKNLWAVVYADKSMGVVDFGQATNFGKRFFTEKPKKDEPLTKVPDIS